MTPEAKPSAAAAAADNPQRRQLRVVLAVALVLLPVLAHVVYQSLTALPGEVTLATGPEGGRYHQFMSQLGRELQQRGVIVTLRPTAGSIEHLKLLKGGQVDLALYQANPMHESVEAGGQAAGSGPHQVTFIANVYSELAHLLVRRDADISSVDDLAGRRVSLAPRESGDHLMARVLLEHIGLSPSEIEAEFIEYSQLEGRFKQGTLDAAFVVLGLDAPVLQSLVGDGHCRLMSIPHRDALLRRQPLVDTGTVPSGYFAVRPRPRPEQHVNTVAVHAELLTRKDVSSVLVETVTNIVLDPSFQKDNRLGELLAGKATFARQHPEFPVHIAALRVYDPKLRSLVDPQLVELTEGLRSLIASLLISGFLGWRWWMRRREHRETHRLEWYVELLETIERQQIQLDSGSTSAEDDILELQRMLDQVTELRWEGLNDFSVHEQMEEESVATFLNLCNALTSKINAKLSRARLDRRFDELLARDPGPG
jgi:TRAP transporter TAXI family solute receptor